VDEVDAVVRLVLAVGTGEKVDKLIGARDVEGGGENDLVTGLSLMLPGFFGAAL